MNRLDILLRGKALVTERRTQLEKGGLSGGCVADRATLGMLSTTLGIVQKSGEFLWVK